MNKRMKLRQYMGAPRRLLRRAREVYIERMVILDENIGPITNVSGFPPLAPPPHNFGGNYWTINDSSDHTHKDPVLLRTASERIPAVTSKEFDIGHEVKHCYSSLGLGRMGTIDEDKWYEFDEEINIRIDLYISKSRSQAIGRRNIGGYY